MIPNDISPYTFGSMSLGKNPVHPEADLAVARRAMDAGVWFHSCRTYNNGFTFMMLRLAFDADPARIPPMILKIRDGSVPLMRFETEDCLCRLPLPHIDIAQLVSMDRDPGNLVDQLRGDGGPLVDELASLKDRGLIRHAVLFMDQGNSDAVVEAADHPLIDGVTLYWNPLQRDCTDSAWQRIQSNHIPVLALRTLGGWRDQRLASRHQALEKTFPEHDPVQLAIDLPHSTPEIHTTIGGTASLDHLEHYLHSAENPSTLPQDFLQRIDQIRLAP